MKVSDPPKKIKKPLKLNKNADEFKSNENNQSLIMQPMYGVPTKTTE